MKNAANTTENAARRRLAREKWRAANPEKDRQTKAAWAAVNRDAINAKARAKYAAERVPQRPKTLIEVAADRQKALQKKRDYQRTYRRENRETVAAIAKRSIARNLTRRNAEKAVWARQNAPRVRAWARRRQAAKLQRTPLWLSQDDLWMIEQAYEVAQQRTRLFGFPWHVDHVLPLRGARVSGLHVPTNLQVIPGAVNVRKGNRTEWRGSDV